MRWFLVLALFSGLSSRLLAREIFVDNRIGSDAFDGRVPRPMENGSGPVATLDRAMALAGFGDQIVLTQAGAVYYDSLSLTGSRCSGTAANPFTILGNGAILSGQRRVPPAGWRKAGPDLWKITLTRKGYYRLLRDGQPLPEFRPESGANPLNALTAGAWVPWQGSVYFRSEADPPSEQEFTYAADQTGLSLHHVHHVRIVDLTFRDFRFDGVHVQNLCTDVRLEGVSCVNNGRAGIAVSGSAHVTVTGGSVAGNGRASLLIHHPAGAELTDTNLDVAPTLHGKKDAAVANPQSTDGPRLVTP